MLQIEIEFGSQPCGVETIRHCLNVLYGTPAGTLALDREFGLSMDALDTSPPVAQATLAAEIIEKTAIYEPRVQVAEVTWITQPNSGALMAKVRCEFV